MAASIARALARIKADVRSAPPDRASVEQACARAGHRWRELTVNSVAHLVHSHRHPRGQFLADG